MAYNNKRKSSKKTKSKFSSNQKAAYHSGRGYAVAHKSKAIDFKNPRLKQAFREGYKAGSEAVSKNPKKYYDLKK